MTTLRLGRVWPGLTLLIFGSASLILAGCGTPPPEKPVAPSSKTVPTKQYKQAIAEGGLIVDYVFDVRMAGNDKKSCYAFISGSVQNNSTLTVSHKSEVHFLVHSPDALLYRDFAHLDKDLPPGARVPFEFLTSPTFAKQCPTFDRIDVSIKRLGVSG